MAEYLDRKAFKEEYLCCGYLPEMSEEEFDAFPAADVSPVVHARWIVLDDCSNEGVYCSKCGKRIYKKVPKKKANFCSNCGAIMDLEEYNG